MNRLKELRAEKNITQEQLGKILGVEYSAISKYERDIVPLQDNDLIKLSSFFEVSIEYLLCKSDVKNPRDSFADKVKPLSEEQKRFVEMMINNMIKENQEKKE